MTQEYLKVSDVAKRTGMSTRTVNRWVTSGILPATRVHKEGAWLIRKKDLERLLEENAVPAEDGTAAQT